MVRGLWILERKLARANYGDVTARDPEAEGGAGACRGKNYLSYPPSGIGG